ncbi:MAG: hypothetical protein ACOH5I_11580 [Oligoflexus sp.]
MQFDRVAAIRLFQVILWQESRRKKLFIFLLLMALLITFLLLFASASSSHVDIEFQYEGETPLWLRSMLLPEMMTLSGVAFKILPAFLLGLMIAIILPWRHKDEWERGTLQMWTLSPWNPVVWELFRVLSYAAVLFIYYVCLVGITAAALLSLIKGHQALVFAFIQFLSLLALTVLPFILGLSTMLSALKAAYRHQSKVWTISVMLTISWWVVVSHALRFLLESSRDPTGYFLPPWRISLSQTSALLSDPDLYWYPEWVLASLLMAALMVYLAGRIYDEIEVY